MERVGSSTAPWRESARGKWKVSGRPRDESEDWQSLA